MRTSVFCRCIAHGVESYIWYGYSSVNRKPLVYCTRTYINSYVVLLTWTIPIFLERTHPSTFRLYRQDSHVDFYMYSCPTRNVRVVYFYLLILAQVQPLVIQYIRKFLHASTKVPGLIDSRILLVFCTSSVEIRTRLDLKIVRIISNSEFWSFGFQRLDASRTTILRIDVRIKYQVPDTRLDVVFCPNLRLETVTYYTYCRTYLLPWATCPPIRTLPLSQTFIQRE